MVSQIREARDGAIRIEDIKPIGRVHLSGRVRRWVGNITISNLEIRVEAEQLEQIIQDSE